MPTAEPMLSMACCGQDVHASTATRGLPIAKGSYEGAPGRKCRHWGKVSSILSPATTSEPEQHVRPHQGPQRDQDPDSARGNVVVLEDSAPRMPEDEAAQDGLETEAPQLAMMFGDDPIPSCSSSSSKVSSSTGRRSRTAKYALLAAL